MVLHFITPNFLIISTILIGVFIIFSSLVSKHDSSLRNFMLITTSTCFILNIYCIDILFFHNISANITLLSFGLYSIALHTEPIGLILLNLLGFLWVWSLIYTIKFIKINDIANSQWFLFFINLTILSAVLITLSANLFSMFIFYEILTISTIPLIAYSGKAKTAKATYRYTKILMLSSMMLFLPAILIIYTKCHNGDFIMYGFIKNYFTQKQAIILLIMFIFGISKAALYPLHGWITSAMVASYPVSAILHAVVVVKIGVFCIYKLLLYVFGLKYLQIIFKDFNWLIYLPIFTIFYASIKSLKTNNIKMVLAYSTITQLSIALLSSFMFTPKSIGTGMLHLVSHAFGKLCLFYCLGNIYSITHSTKITDLVGVSRKMPITSLLLLICCLSLIGLPPFGGFISKFYIIIEAAKQDQIVIMFVMALSSIFSALYLGKIIIALYKHKITSSDIISHDTILSYSVDIKSNMGSINTYINQLENIIPKSMFFSIIVCLCCNIFYFFILGFINQFLSFLQ